jgi:hypothetical protein
MLVNCSATDSDTAPARNVAPLQTETHEFPSVPHSTGTLSLSVTYLTLPNFQLDELESLLSSRFLSLDEGPEFTPTLAKNQQQHSISGSLPVRTSLPVSPASSVADRFVLPSRVASLGVSPRNVPLPITRSTSATAAESNSGPSAGSSAWSKDETRPLSGLAAARLRKESLGRGGVSDHSSPFSAHVRCKLTYHAIVGPPFCALASPHPQTQYQPRSPVQSVYALIRVALSPLAFHISAAVASFLRRNTRATCTDITFVVAHPIASHGPALPPFLPIQPWGPALYNVR